MSEGKISASAGQDSSRAFSIQIVIGLVVVGVLSFAAFIVLSAFADDLRKPEDGGPHAQSKSAVGFAALVDLLHEEGLRVRVSRGALRELRGYNQLTVLSPLPYDDLSEGQIYATTGDVLVVLPKWDTWMNPEHPGWVRSAGLERAEIIERILDRLGAPGSISQGAAARDIVLERRGKTGADLRAGRIDRLQTLVSASVDPILTDEAGHTVLGRLRLAYVPPAVIGEGEHVEVDGFDDEDPHEQPAPEEDPPWEPANEPYSTRNIFVLADPDLINTKGLASIDTARAGLGILRLITRSDSEIVFDMSLHGMERSRSFMKLLLAPPFLPAVLCLVFAAGLMAVNSIAGRMRVRSGREIALGKETLVDNSALLVSLAGRDAHMGRRYAAMTRALAAAAAGVPARASEAQQAAMLDAATRSGEDRTKYSQLADEVAKASTSSTLLKAANRLFRWRQEIGREHRRR